jgi:hypothetical protein
MKLASKCLRALTPIRSGTVRILHCYEEIMMRKETFVSPNFNTLFRQVTSGTRAFPPLLLDIGDDDPDYQPTVEEEVPPT